MAARSADGRVEIVAKENPEVELHQIDPEEGALQRVIHQAERLRKNLWLYKKRPVPRVAVFTTVKRAPRSLEELQAVGRAPYLTPSWAEERYREKQLENEAAEAVR